MIYSIKNKDELKDSDEWADLQPKVKQVSLVEKLGKQGFHYDVKKIYRLQKHYQMQVKNYLRRPNPIQKQLLNGTNQINLLKL